MNPARQSALRAWLRGFAVTCGGYIATGWLGLLILHAVVGSSEDGVSTALALPWLPTGVGVAGLLYYGRRVWPAVLVGCVVVWAAIQGYYLPLTLPVAAGETLSVVVIVSLLRAWGFRPALDRHQDSLLLIAALGIGAPVSSAVLALSIIAFAWLAHEPNLIARFQDVGVERSGATLSVSGDLIRFAARWWANVFAGGVLVVPLLTLADPVPRARQPCDRTRLLLLAAATLLLVGVAFALPAGTLWPALLLGGLLLVASAAIRFGVGVAAAVTMTLAMGASLGFGLQRGTFSGLAADARLAVAWGFIGLLSGTALFLNALLSHRERTRRALAASSERYRALFMSNPYPMWAEEAGSGRIIVANPAALHLYGYDGSAFLGLKPPDLRLKADPTTAPRAAAGQPVVTRERHRSAAGAEFDVEVTRATTDDDDGAFTFCFVEPLADRDAMRLAVLTAGDLERFRLGGAIHDQLMPHLRRILLAAERLHPAPAPAADSVDELLAAIAREAGLAGTVCGKLTRGASPLQYADGDLAEALRRLPASFPDTAADVQVSIESGAQVTLSLERRDHIYRLAEDAVRASLARPGAGRVELSLQVTETAVRVIVEDDGQRAAATSTADTLALRSIGARAAAASGRVQVSPSLAGGSRISFECAQERQAVPPPDATARPAAIDLDDATPAAEPTSAVEPISAVPATTRWLRQLALLTVAYVTTAVLGVWYLPKVSALQLSFHAVRASPWVAGGVAIVGLLWGGARLWPAVFVGYVFIWHGLAHEGWITVLVAAAAQVVGAVVTVHLLRRFGFRRSFDRFHDIVLLVAAAAIGRTLVVPADLFGLQVAATTPSLSLASELHGILVAARELVAGVSPAKLDAVARWWMNGVAGIVLVVPAVVSWSSGAWRGIRARGLEFLVWSLTLIFAAETILATREGGWRLSILALGLTVVTWAAVRFGVGLASTATLLLSLTSAASFGLRLGTLSPSGPADSFATLWGFILVLAATAQVLTALLAGTDRAERELQQLDRRYRGLFEAVPHPLFSFSPGTGRIRLANPAATRRYGYSAAEFERMTLGDLDADPGQPTPALRPQEPLAGPARHRTKSAGPVDVEISLTPIDIESERAGLCFAIDVSERNRLRSRMIEATDRERRHLAREFHDGLGQVLTGLQLGVASLMRMVRQGVPLDDSAVDFVAKAAAESLRTCERILRGISPLQETGGDLLAAIRKLPELLPPDSSAQLSVSASTTHAVTLALEMREHLYQLTQEAVNNALKHAGASRISVTMAVTAAAIELTVDDDGIGFDLARRSGGLGLDSLGLRAAALRARLEIARRPTRGMRVRCVCPQRAEGGARPSKQTA